MKKLEILLLITITIYTLITTYDAIASGVSAGSGGGGGASTVGTFSGSAQTNGADITGSTITFGPASNTVPGMVGTGAQTWAGAKTFSSAPVFSTCTATTVPYLDASKVLTSSAVTPTELGYVSGVTSAIQTQFTAKAPLASPVFTGQVQTDAGSVGTPAYSFSDAGNTNTGMYSTATDEIAFSLNGVKYMTLASPQLSLTSTHVNSTRIELKNTSSGGTAWVMRSLGSDYDSQAGGLIFSNDTVPLAQAFVNTKQGSIGLGYLSYSIPNGRIAALSVESHADANVTGTTTANAATAITITSGLALGELAIGDQVSLSSATTTFAYITAIASNTSITVDAALGDGTSQTVKRRRALFTAYDKNRSEALVYHIKPDGSLSLPKLTDNSTGLSLQFDVAQASVTTADTYIDFRSTSGSEGTVAGSAVAGVIAYNTFTGSHWTKTRGNPKTNDLLCAVGTKPGINNKNQLFNTEVCNKAQDKRVIGTYGGKTKDGYDTILAIGTGYMIVSNTGKDIEVGDFLTSSNVAGLAELQSDDINHNYTAGKATEDIKWKNGETERTISVIYLGG